MTAAALAVGAAVYLAALFIGTDPPELRGRHRRRGRTRLWEAW